MPSGSETADPHAGAWLGAFSAVATIVVLACAGLGAWYILHRPGPALPPSPPSIQAPAETPVPPALAPPAATSSQASPPAQPPPNATVPPEPPEFPVTTASVATILADVPTGLSVFRLAENPNIIVLDFASLPEQGRMLDRIAALTEKQELPRDRVLSPPEMTQAVQKESDGTGWFYYGHDYSVAELNRFFDLAAQQSATLSPQEAKLERLLTQLHWRNAGGKGALISLPRVGADDNVSDTTRHTILTHELSHGEYFSNPAYADFVHQFWQTALTAPERQAFRDYLAHEGYDRNSQEIMENETQAYLLFTRDPKFFTPSDVGMTAARRAELRATFQRDMPAGWLKDLLANLP